MAQPVRKSSALQPAEAIKEAVAVAVGPKDPAALDAADDEMVHSTGTIEARAA